MLEIQNWLRSKECDSLRKLILGEIAALQEKSSRLLIISIDDPKKLADAQGVAEQANKLVKFLGVFDTIARGEYDFMNVQLNISEKLLWQ